MILTGVLLAVALSPTKSGNQYQTCVNNAEDIYDVSVSVLHAAPSRLESDADKKTQNEYKQRYHENRVACSDLKAQWAMAVITYTAFWVGLLGIILVYLTLKATRETIKVTRESSDAQLTELQKSTRLDMQPYLSCRAIKVREQTRVEGQEVQTHQTFIIKNNGKTPAYIRGSRTNVIATFHRGEISTNSKDFRGRAHQSWYIPPDGEVEIPMFCKYEFEGLFGGVVDFSEIKVRGNVEILYTSEFSETGKELSATFDYMLGRDTLFIEGVAEINVGRSYAIIEKDKPKRSYY